MTITFFIRRDFLTVPAFSGIQSIRSKLIQHAAMVVQDEDLNPLGILTPLDIVRKPHTLVIDCMQERPTLSPDCSIEEALAIMQGEQSDVLPVCDKGKLEGLVFKNDLLQFLNQQRMRLEEEVSKRTHEIKSMNERLEISRQILQAVFDSTQSTIFLVAPDRKIIFFNKMARDACRAMYKRELQVGDSILEYMGKSGEGMYRSFEANFERSLQGENVVSEEELNYPGNSLWVRAEYSPVYDGDRVMGVAITISDINERKKYELQIHKQNELLTQISWMQSHETRQPVATILGLINVIDKSTLSDDNRSIIEMLEKTALKLDEIIRDTVIKANSLY